MIEPVFTLRLTSAEMATIILALDIMGRERNRPAASRMADDFESVLCGEPTGEPEPGDDWWAYADQKHDEARIARAL